jgi:hypothetical protein
MLFACLNVHDYMRNEIQMDYVNKPTMPAKFVISLT